MTDETDQQEVAGGSIAGRIWTYFGASVAALLLLLLVLGWTVLELQSANHWVLHSQRVIDRTNGISLTLASADTAERSFLLTEDLRFLHPIEEMGDPIPPSLDRLVELASDDPDLAWRVQKFSDLVHQRLEMLGRIASPDKGSDTGADPKQSILGASEPLSQRISDVAEEIILTEQGRLQERIGRATTLAVQVEVLLSVATPLALVLLFFGIRRTIGYIRRPLQQLRDGARRIASGAFDTRLPIERHDEFGMLARDFNRMAIALDAAASRQRETEARLRLTNETLQQHTHELQDQRAAIDLMARMAHRLQQCADEQEYAQVVGRFGWQILPGTAAALYLLNNSGNLLTRVGGWGRQSDFAADLRPEDCWGIRRAAVHEVHDPHSEIICAHVSAEKPSAYACIPLAAQGKSFGLLHLRHTDASLGGIAEQDLRQRVERLGEDCSLALHNLKLQSALRDSSIRDPLTGLFNRRYMEEILQLEAERAERSQAPLAILMVDLDHFKRLNDTYGHKVGDVVLRDVARTLKASLRKGDIACRYGGEEILCLLPGADGGTALERANLLCEAVRSLHISSNGQVIGPVPCSIGAASLPEHASRVEDVIGQADEALYKAKQNGRNRAMGPDSPAGAA